MLHLAEPTREGWVDEALAAADVVLLDHAHCEKKAASTALNLIFRYQHHEPLLRPLSALAREELEHFEQVLDVLAARDIAFRRLRPSPYAARLHEVVRPREPERLMDVLLCAALIEARSCERMKLLSAAWPDPELRDFYTTLLACEARHHTTYVDLAARMAPRAEVERRLAAVAAHEAAVLRQPAPSTRLHS